MQRRNWRVSLLAEESLKDILHRQDLKKPDKLLAILAVNADTPKTVKQITEIAQRAGFRLDKNASSILSHSKGLAIRTTEGWELSPHGRRHVAALMGSIIGSPVPTIAAQLRSHLPKITQEETRKFVEQAIQCFESHYYRAAVVLSWVGAVAVLYDFIVSNHLRAFNTEAKRRDNSWKNAKTPDDLARMKESDFLDILEALSVFGKSVKLELKKRLDLRNGCGHPNSLQVGENMVAAHIESLILNVFSVYSV
jgi:hypothetical protein